MTRVVILADTHGHLNPDVLETAAGCDLAVHAGDVGAADVLEALVRAGLPVRGARGNNDRPAHPWWGMLHEELTLDLPGGTLAVIHGHQIPGPVAERHCRLRRRYPGARAVVFGHSHRLVCDTEVEPWVLNPGAAGRARTYGGPSCLVLDADARRWRVSAHRFPLPERPRLAAARRTGPSAAAT